MDNVDIMDVVLDTSVVNVSRMTMQLERLADSAIHFGVDLIVGILILIAGFWLANRLVKMLRKVLQARHVEASLVSFLLSLTSIVTKVLVVIIVLTTIGVKMTSIIAVVGAASLAIGLALQGTLQNFAGGVAILLFKPFKVGDFIETQSGYTGTVQAIFIFTTRIKTPDNKVVFLPNGTLSNGVIMNDNMEGERRVECNYSIAYGDDVPKAREVLLSILKSDERVHKTPEPVVYLSKLTDSSVSIMTYFWTDASYAFPIQFDVNEKVYEEFTKEGITFPFAQLEVHIDKENQE